MRKTKLIFSNVDPEKYFLLNDGRSIKNLEEMNQALMFMNANTYEHHANEEKNDFSNWVEHVFEDKELANSIKTSINSQTAAIAINNRIRQIRTVKRSKELENSVPITSVILPKKSVKTKIKKNKTVKRAARKNKIVSSKKQPISLQDELLIKAQNFNAFEGLSAGMKEYVYGMMIGVIAGVFIGVML